MQVDSTAASAKQGIRQARTGASRGANQLADQAEQTADQVAEQADQTADQLADQAQRTARAADRGGLDNCTVFLAWVTASEISKTISFALSLPRLHIDQTAPHLTDQAPRTARMQELAGRLHSSL